MRRNLRSLRRSSPSLILVLALGCGDSSADGDDEASAGTTQADGTSEEASDNVEAGSEGNTTGAEAEGESSSEGTTADTDAETDADTDTSTDDTGTGTDGTDTETGEPPPNCLELDEPTCNGEVTCVPYLGTPYGVNDEGTICLGEPQFIGCLFAADACLPATGTLCMGDDAFAVDSLCPPPEGFESCDPPVDNAQPCQP